MAPPVCYRHPGRETYIACTRCERPICPDCMVGASVGFQCPACVQEGAATVRQPTAAFGGAVRSRPVVTQVLLATNVVAFLATTFTGTGVLFGGSPSPLFQRLALSPSLHPVFTDGQYTGIADGVAQGQYYRLLTAMFLHFGIVHIALNMFCLYSLGPFVEAAVGRLRFAGLYLLSGLAGSALSYLLGPSTELGAGASGAVFGLFAAFFVLQRRRGADVTSISVTIVLNLLFSFSIPNIDWRGHVGGLIGGALVTAALVYAPQGPRRSLVQAAGGAGVALLVVAVVLVRTSALSA